MESERPLIQGSNLLISDSKNKQEVLSMHFKMQDLVVDLKLDGQRSQCQAIILSNSNRWFLPTPLSVKIKDSLNNLSRIDSDKLKTKSSSF